MSAHIEEIGDLNFDDEVLTSNQPYLLDFSAGWCAPCRALEPLIEEFARKYEGKLRVGKCDIDQSPGVAARYGVRGAPTLVVFRQGKESARRIGLASRAALASLIGLE